MVFESGQRLADSKPEEIDVTAKVGNGLARHVQQERQPPHFVGDVAGHSLHLGHVGVSYAQFQQVSVRLAVIPAHTHTRYAILRKSDTPKGNYYSCSRRFKSLKLNPLCTIQSN